MLGRFWLTATIILVLASLLLQQVSLLMVALLFFLAGGAARLWDKNSLKRVTYRRKLSSQRVFFGETIDLEVEIANRKPLPLPWVETADEMPRDVTLLKGKTEASYLPLNVVLTNLFTIGWYHKIKRHYPLQCRQRGYYTFGPAVIRTGDIFGFFTRQTESAELDHLTVYPRILPIRAPILPSTQPLGDVRTRSHLFQDPVLTQGVREYVAGDSLKRIHWKNTARHGELHTRVLEATTTMDLALFLDVRTVPTPHWGSNPEKLELAIITAVALANQALSGGTPAGLYVNQYEHGTSRLIHLPPGRNPVQFRRMLDLLAPLQELEALPINRFILNESRNLPWGSAIALITAAPDEETERTLLKLKRAGRKVSLFKVGGEEPKDAAAGIPTYYVPDTVPWQEIETVELKMILDGSARGQN